MTISGRFGDLVHRLKSLSWDDQGGGNAQPDEPLSLPAALEFQYRLILARSPDRYGVAHLDERSENRTLAALCETLASAEFLDAMPFHLDRLRGESRQAVTWHLHLPRTAGSKLKAAWQQAGHVLTHVPPIQQLGGQPYWRTVVDTLAQFADALDAAQRVLVSGHISMVSIDRSIRPGDSVVASVRDPIQRVLSVFRYARQMCEGGDAIIGILGGELAKSYYTTDWRRVVAASGLDPDGFTLPAFVQSGLCPDGQLAFYLCPEPDVDDLAGYVRNAGIRILGFEEGEEWGLPVNRTKRTEPELGSAATAEWLRAYYAKDVRHYEQLRDLRGSAHVFIREAADPI